jgi:hypothetical protein
MRATELPACTSLLKLPLMALLVVIAAPLPMLLQGCESCGITSNTVLDDDDAFVADDDDGTQTYEDEDCSNGLDDDQDGATDCADSDCFDNPNCAHECVAAETISCGDNLSANNGGAGHTDAVDTYDSCTTWDESGPEYTFAFTPDVTEEVTAALTVAGHGNLDVFVLEDDGSCEGTDCIAYGASTVHWTATAGQDYLIVVDGYAGGQDNFSLELLCPSGGGDGENCFNGIDDDGDGDVDCDDSDCGADPYCLDEECGNNLDDDGDGYVDCDDTECWGDASCAGEDCENGVDDDGDFDIDCADSECFGYPTCNTEECRDGIDNDGDGLTDCDDPDCFGDSDCIDEICGNGLDDDGDGLFDCDDDECFPEPDCVQEDCTNGIDDDADGAIDCADPECGGTPSCTTEQCTNGVDDDGDGDVDCDDEECDANAACASVCVPVDSITCSMGSLTGNTDTDPNAGDVISQYGCTPSNENGNELAYSWVAEGSGEVTFTIDGLSSDLDLFGLQDAGLGCDPASCLDSSTSGGSNPESITMTVSAGTTYYVVVDGWNNNVGEFTLNIACNLGGSPENCTNGIDDDGDGDVDCDDSDCVGAAGCTGELCTDGIDNDGDGQVDCADSDCVGTSACLAEDCFNGADDDGDGLADCDDPECSILPSCSSENCYDNIDNDGDALIDCDDPDCTGDPMCNPDPGGDEDCSNGFDDDGDGLVDCMDPVDCGSDPACGGPVTENCANGTDDDGNGLVDCDDPMCASDPACGGPSPEICDDGIDNDGDGAIDCDDVNCDADTACGGSGGEDCGNNFDDNGNGDVDCDDILCLFDILCWILSEDCSDGSDNDWDGAVDCADLDCEGEPACTPEDCTNTIDDDEDGDIDCADSECATAPACLEEDCDNGSDDDLDGQVDCADSECMADPVCVTENCSNGIDDDGDGDTDCDDSECTGNPVCASAEEICDNDADDNGDGLIDCADPTCASDPNCIAEICWNGTDDDGDLMADCDDPECAEDINCQDEICWNGVDDDGDGDVDCDDDDCLGWPSCDSENCSNGIDDDGDLDIDCDDTGCYEDPNCLDEICDNDADDDMDGLIDCGDPDCDGTPDCTSTGEICDNGVDDDGDGDVDCNDSDCEGLPACTEDCGNGVDDDGDGDVDCDDSDCTGTPGCAEDEICDDGVDNDGDGAVDCADSDCASEPECIAEDCSNGIDDDGDGDIDCDDSECEGDFADCGEDCSNYVDDDGDGDIDCDDSDCVDDEDCEDVGGTCIEQWELECGDSDSYRNWGPGSASVIDQYSCTPWDETGPEYTYVFRPEASEEVTVCLSNMSEDLDLFIINESGGCDGANCFDYGNGCTTIDAVAGEQYYFVVDGYQGAMGTYDIAVECPSTSEICDNGIDDDGDSLVDCDDDACEGMVECLELCNEGWSLFCGSTDDYSTLGAGASDSVDSYSCTSWVENGPEFAYYFQAPLDQANEVTVELSYDWSLDLDVFILNDQGIPCNSDSCIEYGALSAEFETEPGADYWIVIDGYQGSQGDYQVMVDCEPITGTEDCDNGVDDDSDELVDCDDPDCMGTELCASYCAEVGVQISCGQLIDGDNTWDEANPAPGMTNNIDGYPCNIGNYAGAEIAYEWVATVTGTVEFALIGAQPTVLNHDIILLDGTNGDCVNTQCVEGGLGFSSLEFESVAGYTYYFVVDGFDGAEGPFQVQLDCNP